MAAQRRLTLRRDTLLIAAGLFVFLMYLYFFVPFGEVVDTVQRANPFYLLVAFGVLLMSTVFYSSRTWIGSPEEIDT